MDGISVIIVSWNAKDYLKKCIETIVDDTVECDVEIIVVDNASGDGSVDMLIKEYPGVKLIQNTVNEGFAKANNIGLYNATGEYVYFINSDVEVKKGCLNVLMNYMKNNENVGLTSPMILNPDGTVQASCAKFPTILGAIMRSLSADRIFPNSNLFSGEFSQLWPFNEKKDVEVIKGCFWAARRAVIDEIGFLDERFFIYAEDMDWCKRFHECGYRLVYNPDCQAIHYGGASSGNEPVRFFLEKNKSDLLYWKKHETKFKCIIYKIILLGHETSRWLIYRVFYLAKHRKKNETHLLKIMRSQALILQIITGTI